MGVTLAVRNPEQFIGTKPGTVLCFGDVALLVLPKNVKGVSLTIVNDQDKVFAEIVVRKMLKLPYPEKL